MRTSSRCALIPPEQTAWVGHHDATEQSRDGTMGQSPGTHARGRAEPSRNPKGARHEPGGRALGEATPRHRRCPGLTLLTTFGQSEPLGTGPRRGGRHVPRRPAGRTGAVLHRPAQSPRVFCVLTDGLAASHDACRDSHSSGNITEGKKGK